jgi:hypothetical protein
MRVTSGGNLGLGTTDPDYGSYGANERILGITGVATNRARLSLQNTATGTSGVSGDISFFNSTTALASVIGQADGATNKGLFAFYTNAGSGLTEKMRLNNLGYLGIGSNNPSALLHIEGNIATPVTEIIRNSSADTAAGGKISFQYTTTETGYLYNRFNGADFETQLQAAQQIIFKTGTTEQMRVANTGDVTVSTGNLVIGTSGKGINFSGAGGDILKTYDEGTYVPADNSGASLTFTGVSGSFTRVGRLVYFTFQITYPSTANASVAVVTLPFPIPTSSGVSIGYTDYTAADQLYASVSANRTGVRFLNVATELTNANLSGKTFIVSGTYQTDP